MPDPRPKRERVSSLPFPLPEEVRLQSLARPKSIIDIEHLQNNTDVMSLVAGRFVRTCEAYGERQEPIETAVF